MPGGYFHQMVTMAATLPVGIGAAYLTSDLGNGLESAFGCLLGVIINPDLDLVAANWPLRILFAPYRWAVPHRSLISHAPVIGTLIRIVYIWALLLLLCIIINVPWPGPERFGWLYVGLCISDILHILADAFIKGG